MLRLLRLLICAHQVDWLAVIRRVVPVYHGFHLPLPSALELPDLVLPPFIDKRCQVLATVVRVWLGSGQYNILCTGHRNINRG